MELARIESSRSISRSDEGGSEATRILVIDDEPAIRAMIRRVLQAYDVVEAASGEEGRQILAEDQSFDLILCDVMMPNVSGMDLHRWLAESFPEVATRVVFITGGAFTPRARDSYMNERTLPSASNHGTRARYMCVYMSPGRKCSSTNSSKGRAGLNTLLFSQSAQPP